RHARGESGSAAADATDGRIHGRARDSRRARAWRRDYRSVCLMRDYIELTKPRITWLILMSTGIGYFFGLPRAATWIEFLKNIPLLTLLHTVLGTALIASGTAALNQWYEREADRQMRRTARRPLPPGKMSAR